MYYCILFYASLHWYYYSIQQLYLSQTTNIFASTNTLIQSHTTQQTTRIKMLALWLLVWYIYWTYTNKNNDMLSTQKWNVHKTRFLLCKKLFSLPCLRPWSVIWSTNSIATVVTINSYMINWFHWHTFCFVGISRCYHDYYRY